MKLFYFLCFASTFAFGQINTEKIVDISWYPTSREGTKTVYSSVKSHKKSNHFIKFKSDQTFIVPNATRRRCYGVKKKFSEGTWAINEIDNSFFLLLTRNNRTTTYKVLYANQGMLELERIK